MIYLVEDDDSIRELVLYALHTTGFEAEGFRNAADFWQALEKELPQLVLLDIMLPDEDGLHILKRLRAGAETADLPVMMLTAKSSEYDQCGWAGQRRGRLHAEAVRHDGAYLARACAAAQGREARRQRMSLFTAGLACGGCEAPRRYG